MATVASSSASAALASALAARSSALAAWASGAFADATARAAATWLLCRGGGGFQVFILD